MVEGAMKKDLLTEKFERVTIRVTTSDLKAVSADSHCCQGWTQAVLYNNISDGATKSCGTDGNRLSYSVRGGSCDFTSTSCTNMGPMGGEQAVGLPEYCCGSMWPPSCSYEGAYCWSDGISDWDAQRYCETYPCGNTSVQVQQSESKSQFLA